jgi:hypothetical protein
VRETPNYFGHLEPGATRGYLQPVIIGVVTEEADGVTLLAG